MLGWLGWPRGQVVGAKYLWGTHMGIVTGSDRWGRPLVTSNSMAAGRVVEQPIEQFASGSTPLNLGFPSRLSRADVVLRARSRLGESYSLLTNNCEHLVSFALGHPPSSPQAQRAVAVAAIALIACIGGNAERDNATFV